MHYPWWYVPVVTSPMLIALIAVVHVVVSHYAVGGGILIALENSHALRKGNAQYRDYWKTHTRFFVLLTVAFGAITGVGIWWTIGLASPLATEMLIRTFVFGWAIEWVFFIVEIVAAFAVYYFWDRLPANTHRIVAWIYAFAAWMSLFLITGITSFMLNSEGLFSSWSETRNFWHAFFNVQLIPQTVLRTGACLLLSTIYVYVHAAWTLRKPENAELLQYVVKRMSKPLLLGIVLLALGAALGLLNLPERMFVVLERAPALNIFLALLFGLAAVLTALTIFGPVLNPKSINLGFAVCLFVFGFTALSVAEFVREALRKPYIVDGVVLGNQIYVDEIDRARDSGGYLQSGLWTDLYLDRFRKDAGDVANDVPWNPDTLAPEARLEIGRAIFLHHCNDCHAVDHGYTAVGPLLVGEDRHTISRRIRRLNDSNLSMPPWCGTEHDAELLAEFLESIRPEHPLRETPEGESDAEKEFHE